MYWFIDRLTAAGARPVASMHRFEKREPKQARCLGAILRRFQPSVVRRCRGRVATVALIVAVSLAVAL
jgi:hypothetical protein